MKNAARRPRAAGARARSPGRHDSSWPRSDAPTPPGTPVTSRPAARGPAGRRSLVVRAGPRRRAPLPSLGCGPPGWAGSLRGSRVRGRPLIRRPGARSVRAGRLRAGRRLGRHHGCRRRPGTAAPARGHAARGAAGRPAPNGGRCPRGCAGRRGGGARAPRRRARLPVAVSATAVPTPATRTAPAAPADHRGSARVIRRDVATTSPWPNPAGGAPARTRPSRNSAASRVARRPMRSSPPRRSSASSGRPQVVQRVTERGAQCVQPVRGLALHRALASIPSPRPSRRRQGLRGTAAPARRAGAGAPSAARRPARAAWPWRPRRAATADDVGDARPSTAPAATAGATRRPPNASGCDASSVQSARVADPAPVRCSATNAACAWSSARCQSPHIMYAVRRTASAARAEVLGELAFAASSTRPAPSFPVAETVVGRATVALGAPIVPRTGQRCDLSVTRTRPAVAGLVESNAVRPSVPYPAGRRGRPDRSPVGHRHPPDQADARGDGRRRGRRRRPRRRPHHARAGGRGSPICWARPRALDAQRLDGQPHRADEPPGPRRRVPRAGGRPRARRRAGHRRVARRRHAAALPHDAGPGKVSPAAVRRAAGRPRALLRAAHHAAVPGEHPQRARVARSPRPEEHAAVAAAARGAKLRGAPRRGPALARRGRARACRPAR